MIFLGLTLGERILILRRRAKLTKKEFARMTHISVSTLNKYEDDKVENPDVDIINNFSIILGVSFQLLMTGLESPEDEKALEPLIKKK